ncbi:hypothetical protein GCM10027031_10580 [Corynebacterium atrinae]
MIGHGAGIVLRESLGLQKSLSGELGAKSSCGTYCGDDYGQRSQPAAQPWSHGPDEKKERGHGDRYHGEVDDEWVSRNPGN